MLPMTYRPVHRYRRYKDVKAATDARLWHAWEAVEQLKVTWGGNWSGAPQGHLFMARQVLRKVLTGAPIYAWPLDAGPETGPGPTPGSGASRDPARRGGRRQRRDSRTRSGFRRQRTPQRHTDNSQSEI